MKIRLERFDEVSAKFDVFDVQIEDGGHLSLWTKKPGGNPLLVGYINSASWSAVYVLDKESEAKISDLPGVS